MERKARIFLVGGFLLVTALGLFYFYDWIDGESEGEPSTLHQLQFRGSVSGLSIGSAVRYLGVPVGRVATIELSSNHPGRVDVVIDANQPLPAASTLIADLEPQGITGLSIIELRDRNDEQPEFEVAADTIPGYPSVLSQLSSAAGSIARSVDSVLTTINEALNEQAISDLNATLAHVRELSGNLATASQDLDRLTASMTRVSRELEQTLPDYRQLATHLNEEVMPTMVAAGKSVQAATDAITAGVDDNREELEQLLRKDMPTLIRMTDELARTLQHLNHMVSNINDQPGALLYGEKVREVEIGLE